MFTTEASIEAIGFSVCPRLRLIVKIRHQDAENIDAAINTSSNHPKMHGKTPFLPLPLHLPTPTGDSWAEGPVREIPIS